MLDDVLVEYGGVEVDALSVYSDMFSLGYGEIQKSGGFDEFKANPIGYYKMNGRKKGHYRIFLEDTFEDTLKELQEADFAIVNGITYFGRKNVQEHASKMYAMIFDLDGVTDSSLNSFLHAAFVKDYDIYPVPNYIVLSGHGVHLYYIFEYPIPLYPNIKIQLKAFKYALTEKMWNEYTSVDKKKQFQGINQGFRPIGGKTKVEGVRARAFRMNTHPYCLEELGRYIPEKDRVDESKLYKESKMSIIEAKKAYPQWYEDRVVNKLPKKCWTVKRDLYDWWKRQIADGATYHHRYFNIMCLAIYAAKCDIAYDELEADALDLIPFMNEINPEEAFTEDDVRSALECYDKRYCTFPIEDIEKLSGILIKRNKRNGQKQKDHLEEARAIRDIRAKRRGIAWDANNGRKSKKQKVYEWRLEHPEGSKAECHRDTQIDPKTIRKWWVEDLDQIKKDAEMKDAMVRRLMGYQNRFEGDII